MEEVKEAINPLKLKEPIELFGYECDHGWYPLIEEAEEWVNDWNLKNCNENVKPSSTTLGWEKLRIVQVKEKFGMLTIYCNFYPDNLHEKLFDLEQRSAKICERCGKTEGTTCKASHGWIYTLCPQCREKEEIRWNKLFRKK